MFRRGRLAFLTTKEDRIEIFIDRINLTEKHLGEVCSSFALCVRKMAKYREACDDLAKTCKNYSNDEEINQSVCEALKTLTNSMTILADEMDLNVQRMKLKILNELMQFESICKNTRETLRTAVIARDKEVLKQRQVLEIKSKFSSNNSAADAELLKAKLEVNRANKEINDIICNFEKRKLRDLKTILTDYTLISMKYHIKALEELSQSYNHMSDINEKNDFLEFQKLMKIKDEPQTRKSGIDKERSRSMENFDWDQVLSPLKQRLTRSHKSLAADKNEDEDELTDDNNDNDDDDDDEEQKSDEYNAHANETNSGSGSEVDNDGVSETASEEKPKGKASIKQAFKATGTVIKIQKQSHHGPSS